MLFGEFMVKQIKIELGQANSPRTTLPNVVIAHVYATLAELWEVLWGEDINDDITIVGVDESGDEVSVPLAVAVAGIKQTGCYAFIKQAHSVNELHLWVDTQRVDKRELMQMLGHELGHMQGATEDVVEEERKAEHYGDIVESSYAIMSTLLAQCDKDTTHVI